MFHFCYFIAFHMFDISQSNIFMSTYCLMMSDCWTLHGRFCRFQPLFFIKHIYRAYLLYSCSEYSSVYSDKLWKEIETYRCENIFYARKYSFSFYLPQVGITSDHRLVRNSLRCDAVHFTFFYMQWIMVKSQWFSCITSTTDIHFLIAARQYTQKRNLPKRNHVYYTFSTI